MGAGETTTYVLDICTDSVGMNIHILYTHIYIDAQYNSQLS